MDTVGAARVEDHGRFPLPTNFLESHVLASNPVDTALMRLIFEPWRELLEWLVHDGEIVDHSLQTLHGLLTLEPALMRRPNMPKPTREALDNALTAAILETGLGRKALFERWNSAIVPTLLRPAVDLVAAAEPSA